jgi:hypothetical protein
MKMGRLETVWGVGLIAVLGWGIGQPASLVADDGIDLSSVRVVMGERASSQEQFAARELQRCLSRLGGQVPPLAVTAVDNETSFVLGTPTTSAHIAQLADKLSLSPEAVGDQGYQLKRLTVGTRQLVIVAAREPVGVLYGVYGLLEQLGFGFYLGGDTFPPRGTPLVIQADLDQVCRPVFGIRGSLPWYNFLDSPTTWDLEDYKFFFQQMAKQRFNFVGFHTYDSEPFVPYEWNGQLADAAPLASSLTYGWGTIRGLATKDFGFGTGEYFDRDPFASRSLVDGENPRDQVLRSRSLLAESLDYARSLGIKVCVGFELTGDPTDPQRLARLEARIGALVQAYPMLDYVWFWQSEGLGGGGDAVPDETSGLGRLVREYGGQFAYLGQPQRIAEAVRVSHYANTAYRIVKRQAPHLGVIVSGWGGDRWMRFGDFYEGLDKTLPPDVVFAALDNIDPAAEPNVAAVYGKLSPQRQRWPIPWWESDGGGLRRDQWAPQCNTKPFVALARDTLAKQCSGMLAIHWRTRDVEEVAGFQARFAWNPALTYEQYYDDFARRCYGTPWAGTMSAVHQQLEALGPRWTGALGQTECGTFAWFDDNRIPTDTNLRTLAEVRQTVDHVRQEMDAAGRTEGLERVDWLLTTIDWLLLYDAAAVKLRPDGELGRLVAELERAHAAGDATARERARAAYDALLGAGLREAMQMYPRKMSTMGEFGTLATMNVKAYAALLKLIERLRRIDPALPELRPESPVAPDEPPRIVMRSPSSTTKPGEPLTVRVAVLSGQPIRSVAVHYRSWGAEPWTVVPMQPLVRRTYEAVLPAEALAQGGLEFFVSAEDEFGRKTCAPIGHPAVTWSVTGFEPRAAAPGVAVAAAQPTVPEALAAQWAGDYEVRLSWTEAAANRGFRYEIFRGNQPDFEPSDANRIAASYLPPVDDLIDGQQANLHYAVVAVAPRGDRSAPARVSLAFARPAPPEPPTGLAAKAGPGKVVLTWKAPDKPLLRFNAYRAEGSSGAFRKVAERIRGGTAHLDIGLTAGVVYRYELRTVDHGGQESTPSETASAEPLPVRQEPVLLANFDGDAKATVAQGVRAEVGQGAVHAPAGFAQGYRGEALDVRSGGHVTFPYDPAFDLSGELTAAFWIKLDTLSAMPVLVSCGEWQKNGWFLQVIGNRFRFYVAGPNVLDTGAPETGRWMHVAAVYDGQRILLYQDGKLAGSREIGSVDYTPWGRPLFVGQYHWLQEPYQVHGLIDDFKLWQRALSAAEIAAEAR